MKDDVRIRSFSRLGSSFTIHALEEPISQQFQGCQSIRGELDHEGEFRSWRQAIQALKGDCINNAPMDTQVLLGLFMAASRLIHM